MTQAVTYERETKSVAFQGKIIVLESLTPVLPPKEKEQRKKEIERCRLSMLILSLRSTDCLA